MSEPGVGRRAAAPGLGDDGEVVLAQVVQRDGRVERGGARADRPACSPSRRPATSVRRRCDRFSWRTCARGAGPPSADGLAMNARIERMIADHAARRAAQPHQFRAARARDAALALIERAARHQVGGRVGVREDAAPEAGERDPAASDERGRHVRPELAQPREARGDDRDRVTACWMLTPRPQQAHDADERMLGRAARCRRRGGRTAGPPAGRRSGMPAETLSSAQPRAARSRASRMGSVRSDAARRRPRARRTRTGAGTLSVAFMRTATASPGTVVADGGRGVQQQPRAVLVGAAVSAAGPEPRAEQFVQQIAVAGLEVHGVEPGAGGQPRGARRTRRGRRRARRRSRRAAARGPGAGCGRPPCASPGAAVRLNRPEWVSCSTSTARCAAPNRSRAAERISSASRANHRPCGSKSTAAAGSRGRRRTHGRRLDPDEPAAAFREPAGSAAASTRPARRRRRRRTLPSVARRAGWAARGPPPRPARAARRGPRRRAARCRVPPPDAGVRRRS